MTPAPPPQVITMMPGGLPVFTGTTVPVKALFEYLAAGDTLRHFLDHYPAVSSEHARAVLKLAAQWPCASDAHPHPRVPTPQPEGRPPDHPPF